MRLKGKNSILIFILIVFTAFLYACEKEKVVPKFLGIEVSETIPVELNTNNEREPSLKKLLNSQKPFGDDAPTIEDKIKDYFDVPTTTEIDLYPSTSAEIYLRIKIKNPSMFIIDSFTLNDEDYSSTQLHEGSDFENLILMIYLEEFNGIKSFTVDNIKYIDGEETKEVEYDGKQTASIGYRFEKAPTARVSQRVVGITSLSLMVDVKDELNVIANTGDILKFVLFDGEEIVQDVDLTKGSSHINLNNLHINSIYQYAVVACYDLVDGQGNNLVVLSKDSFQTKSAVTIKNIKTESESISFDIDITEIGRDIFLTAIEIYHDGELVQSLTDLSTRSFTNLLSNNVYTIKVSYKYNPNDGTEDRYTSITINPSTKKKREPFTNISNISSTDDSISFSIDVYDVDEVGMVSSIRLYRGNTLIKDLTDTNIRTFTGLESNTEYTIKVIYTYDLNEGLGSSKYEDEADYQTKAFLEVTNIEILNIGNIESHEYVSLRITLDNSDYVTISSFVISGQKVSVGDPQSSSVQLLEYRTDFPGGMYTAKVDAITYRIDGIYKTVEVDSELSDEIFVLGDIRVESIYNDNNNIIGIDTENFINIGFFNPTGYEIKWIGVIIDGTYYLYEQDEYIQIDQETIRIPLKGDLRIIDNYNIKSVVGYTFNYGIIDGEYHTLTHIAYDTYYFYIVNETEEREIKTADDLFNIESGYVYRLKNDIDLEGYEWIPLEFNGAIFGDGYKIKNLTIETIETDEPKEYDNVGLFSIFRGFIDDLHLENVLINVRDETSYIGGFVGEIYSYSQIRNCSITGDIIVNNSSSAFVGGFAGLINNSYISNNFNNVKISVESGHMAHVGGIAGNDIGSEIYCNNIMGTIVGKTKESTYFHIGGLIGYTHSSKVKDNIVTSEIYLNTVTNYNIGGLIGACNYSKINQNIYNGEIEINHDATTDIGNVGGISGRSFESNIYSNISIGRIDVDTNVEILVGGIVGEAWEDYVELNIFCGRINIMSLNSTVKVGAITTDGSHDIDYYENFYTNESVIIEDNALMEKIGELVYDSYLDTEGFYLYDLYWDGSNWDFSELDYYNGKLPVLK